MANKLDLKVSQGSSYNPETNFALNFDISNRDTNSVALSALEVISYGWIDDRLGTITPTVLSVGKLSQWATLNSFQGQNGIQALDMFNTSYRINHATIDPTKVYPQLSLNIPVGGSSIGTISYTNHTSGYFDIVIPDSAPTLGYSISWYLPAYTEDVFNGSVPDILSPTVTIQKLSVPYVTSAGLADSKIKVSWPSSTQIIPTGYSLENVSIIVVDNYSGLSNISNWYTKLPIQKKSESTVVLLQDGLLVTEYVDASTLDPFTGVSAVPASTTVLSASENVYISSSLPNPLKTSASNKNDLIVAGPGASEIRSLVKFNINSIPQTTKVTRAILRLNPAYSGSSGQFTIAQITENWNESDATWNQRFNGVNWTTFGGSTSSIVTSSYSITQDNWIDFDITDIVESWRFNKTNYGLMIRGSGPDNIVFNSSRNVGTGTPSGTPTLIIQSSSDVSVKSEKIKLLIPSDASIYSLSESINITVSAAASVTSVSAHAKVGITTVNLGVMNNTGDWTLSMPVSAITTSGTALVYARGTDSSGTYETERVTISINALPTFTVTNPSVIVSAGATPIIYAVVNDYEGYNRTLVEIISAGSVIMSGNSNVLGEFSFPVTSTGTISLSAKVYDGNPVFSTNYSITPFTLNIAKFNATLSVPYTNAKKNTVTIVPNVKVVPSTFNYTASVTVTGSTYSTRYLLKKNGGLAEILTNNGSTLTSINEGLYDLVMEVTSGSAVIETVSVRVYIRKSSVVFNASGTNSCSGEITLSGNVQDTDLPNDGIIDNEVLVGLYQNNTLMDYLTLNPLNQFNQVINPAVGAGVITVKVLDDYGNITGESTKDIGNVYDETTNIALSVKTIKYAPSPNRGTITDPRDGKVYKTVLMPDGKWWMAENLNYAGYGGSGISGAGRLYTVNEATSATIPGCHLPTQEGTTGGEWWYLFNQMPGGTSTGGLKLKSTTGWTLNGLNEYGFNVIPSGKQTRTYTFDPWGSIETPEDGYFIGNYSGPSYDGVVWFSYNSNVVGLAGTYDNEKFRGAIRLIVDSGNVPDTIIVDSSIHLNSNLVGSPDPLIEISATSQATDIVNYLFTITDVDGNQTIVNSQTNTIPFTLTPKRIYNVNVVATTAGGCTFTDDLKVFDYFPTKISINLPSAPKCYCTSERFDAIAVIDSIGKFSAQFQEAGFTYQEMLSGSFNSTLVETETVEPDSDYVWAFSTSGSTYTSATVRLIDGTGRLFTKTQILTPAIAQSPIISLVSPVSSTIYKENDVMSFEVNVTSGALQSIKYYVDDVLIGMSSIGPSFRYSWTSLKPNKVYSVKAVGISPTGCLSNVINSTFTVSNAPVVKILNKVDTKYIAPGVEQIKAEVYSNSTIGTVYYKDVTSGSTNVPMIWNSAENYWYYNKTFTSGFGSSLISICAVDILGTSGMDSYTVVESSAPNVVLTILDNDVQLTETVTVSAVSPTPYTSGAIIYSSNTGSITDPRDGKVYKTVLMPDGKWWLAENMAWTGAGVDYNNNPSNRSLYGRLYNWLESFTAVLSGTHIPSDADWDALAIAAGGGSVTGGKLRSVTGWSGGGAAGTNNYGFTALPGGEQPGGSSFAGGGYYAFFWTSDAKDAGAAWDRRIVYGSAPVYRDFTNKSTRFSVRLIVDSGNIPDILPSTEHMSVSNGSLTKELTLSSFGTSALGTATFPAYEIGVGVHSLTATATNSKNVVGYSTPKTLTVSLSGNYSKPIIKNISNTPEGKVSSTPIVAVFDITDNMNGIDPSTITFSPSANIQLVSLVPSVVNKSYILTVIVNKSGYVEITAKNFVGVESSYRFNNYVITCSTGRQINLTSYLPEYLRDDNAGNPSETFKFLGHFEQTLNSIYSNLESGCNLSTLEKVSRLQKLHDIDTIDSQFIPNYSDLMGYKTGFNAEEIGSFGYFPTSAEYTDTTEEYKNKALRFVVRNLPNWYSIKTTRNSLKIMLLSFGIIGDVVDYYTTDYRNDWYASKRSNDQFVDPTLPKTSYPTPHMSIGIDLSQTMNSDIYGDGKLSNVIDAMEAIRPANVVINGITGYLDDVILPGINIAMSFVTSTGINVEFESQINKQ